MSYYFGPPVRTYICKITQVHTRKWGIGFQYMLLQLRSIPSYPKWPPALPGPIYQIAHDPSSLAPTWLLEATSIKIGLCLFTPVTSKQMLVLQFL